MGKRHRQKIRTAYGEPAPRKDKLELTPDEKEAVQLLALAKIMSKMNKNNNMINDLSSAIDLHGKSRRKEENNDASN